MGFAAEQGDVWIRSPLVLIARISTLPGSHPCAASNAAAAIRAWASASGDPRLPMVKRDWVIGARASAKPGFQAKAG